MKRLSGKIRITIFISVIWFFLCAIVGYLEHDGVLGFFWGLFPLVFVWGIWWIKQGFKKEKSESVSNNNSDDASNNFDTINTSNSSFDNDRKPCPDESCVGIIDQSNFCNECKRSVEEIENGISSRAVQVSFTSSETKGIGGWLILPLLGLFTTPILILLTLKEEFLPFFLEEGLWETLTVPGNEAYHHLWAPFIVFEGVLNLLFIIFTIVILILYFKKSKRLPELIIIYYVSNVAILVADLVFSSFLPNFPESTHSEMFGDLTRVVILAIIWSFYFSRSKRVKATFIN